MNKINLMKGLLIDPFVIEPKEAKNKNKKRWENLKKKTDEEEIQTIVMCGCGNHPINPKKDPYMQHNKWAAQFHPHDECGRTDIRNVKGIGTSRTPYKPTYDFSGDDFEVTTEIIRKFNDK